MTVESLLGELTRRGIALTLDGADLKISAPRGALDADLREALRTHKAALVVLLSAQAGARAAHDIAIIGMSCRLPGAAGVAAYWELLREGRSAVCEIPAERWDYRAWYAEQASAPRYMGFLPDAALFDAPFFQISAREARLIDPQQRMFLEVAWEAFESAGSDPTRYAGRQVGVFVGCGGAAYGQRIWSALGPRDYAAGLGTQGFAIPNRTSYFFDFHGPSLLVSTACSASLVAMHMACESLRRGESELALAGGVNLLLSPAYYLCMAHMGALSPDGSCRTFDRRANGIVLGEGIGALLLKPLARALADGDRVLAVIRGSAVNHDGRTNGLSAPNPGAQAELVRSALADAGLAPADIAYVEAHGTGTALGDPMEVEALAQVFAGLPRGSRRIGSVKTNLGHLETAAGVASVIKVVLAMQHGQLPPHVGFEEPNPLLSFDETPFVVNSTLTPWPAQQGSLRRAGVSGFGMGGTNAHLILEEAPALPPAERARDESTVITLSARSERSLAAQVRRLGEQLARTPDVALADLARTLNAGRAHMPYRRAFTVSSTAELRAELDRPGSGVAGHVGEGAAAAPPGEHESLAAAYVRGAEIDWQALERQRGGRVITLPSYAWDHERHWVDVDPNVVPGAVPAPGAQGAEVALSAPLSQVELVWEPLAPLPSLGLARVLVCPDASGVGEQLAAALGGPIVKLRELDVQALHAQLLAAFVQGERLDVVCLTALDAEGLDLEAALQAVCEPALKLVQGLVAARIRTRLWLCTRGAQALAGEAPSLAQAALWGIARTVMHEHPELECRALDLDPSALDLDALRGVLGRPDQEDQLMVRGAALFGARLSPCRPAPASPALGPGTVLLTGAFGGLGRIVTRWLAERGVSHLALLGRNPPSDEARTEIAALEARGVRVHVLTCDAGDRAELSAALDGLRRAGPAITGVIHGAGLLDDGVLAQQRWPRFASVLRPKALGAAHLDALTRDDPLAFFVSFSSLASLLGSPGQANYAAANACLDALAHQQRRRGLRAVALQWGPWSDAGMAQRLGPAHVGRLAAQGIGSLASDVALDALAAAIGGEHAQLGVLAIDWARFADGLPAGVCPPLLTRVLATGGSRNEGSGERLAQLPATERRRELEALVRAEATKVLGNAADGLPLERPLAELGLDSLMAVELRNGLARALARPLSATLLFDHPTLDSLVAALDAQLSSVAPALHRRSHAQRGEPIAIVGVGLRMPDGVTDLASFARFLYGGSDAIREVPRSRWDVDAFYDPDPDAPGKTYSRWGSFVDDVDRFDADFFGISPREAVQMDPQQRLLLEVAWEAIEDAGIPAHTLAGTRTGVFLGIGLSGYGQHQLADERARIDGFTATGMITSAAVGRISYVLGLKGPSLAVETACSSSLVSVHLACQSLRCGESDLALAGGVNLLLSPEGTIMFSKARALSKSGRCRTFDAGADGYVRGEGAGVVLLKPLSRAIADGDPIHAVIRGSAVNQDGKSGGLTAPNGPSQEAVLRDALAMAGVEPHEVAYLEAHGTGTPLGDPIELQAAARVYGEGRRASAPLLVGSVKTQVGHLEMAAGIAGVLKLVVALGRDEIAPHLHFAEPNPLIPWAELPVQVTRQRTAWPADRKKLAAVSAFGFGGTNAHVVMEAFRPGEPLPSSACRVLVMSARSEAALRELALRFAALLREPDCDLSAVCAASQSTRTHFVERLALHAASPLEAARELEAFARGETSRVRTGRAGDAAEWPVDAAAQVDAFISGATPSTPRSVRVKLPHYPWQRERFWIDAGAASRAFSVVWQAYPAVQKPLAGRWLILAQPGPLPEALARTLQSAGATCVSASEVAPGEGLAGIVALTALEADEADPVAAQRAVLEAVAGILRAGGDAPIWLVTRGAQHVPSDARPDLALAQAPAWGVGRVLAAEHPQRFGGLIDLDLDGDPASDGASIVAAVQARGEQLAVRRGKHFAARLVPHVHASTPRLRLRDDGVYLLTGASGHVGLSIARWLVARGVRHLLLVSRRGTDARTLAALGVHAESFCADVGSADGVRQVLARVDASGLPLRGVVHAAGVLDDGLLADHDWSRAEAVLAPKVRGACELDRLTRTRSLDLFLLVSSSASLLGAAGQGAYAAANGYLDALAHARAQRALPALSVNFGPWTGGMAERAGEAQQRRWAAGGMGLLGVEAVWAELDALHGHGVVQALVAELDTGRLVEALGDAALPVVSHREVTIPRRDARAPRPVLRERLLAHPPAERRQALLTQLESDLCKVLGLGTGKRIDAERGFAELGVDSLLALELRNRLAQDLGLTLPATLAIDHPTLHRLADFLLARLADTETTRVELVQPQVRSAADEPIAIIGMGLRLPGDVHDAASYWQLLAQGVDATSEVPRGRWDIDALYDPDPDAPGRIYTRRGGFLREVDRFDAAFFGISPREAVPMDPQQRLLLEVAWEALEHAGQSPTALRGTRTGIFVGIGINDYGTLQGRGKALDTIDAYRGTGNGYCFSAGRLSYHLGLQGPSLAVDTACSSSLVAIHLAAQSLRSGESDLALAGGVHLMLAPETMVLLCRTRALSPDGRCKTFDASADGYGRGEGAALVVLKRLSDALAAGDRIEAVLRATAVNHDGPASGLTVPNGPAQQAVIEQALARAGLAPRDVSYVEAHGTGTALGDPMEVAALAAVYGKEREERLRIGSVKTNLGHLEAASGIAGLLKVVLALQHRELPAHLHLSNPSPHIDWRALPIEVPTARTPWPSDRPRVAGVSSFGLSGTNAHVLVEEAPPRTSQPSHEGSLVVPLSAQSQVALRELAARLAVHLRSHPEIGVAEVAATLGRGRAHFKERWAVVVRSREELIAALEVRAQTVDEPPRDMTRVALVFSAGDRAMQLEKAFALRASGVEVAHVLGERATELAPALGARALDYARDAKALAAEAGHITFVNLSDASLPELVADLYVRGAVHDFRALAPQLSPVALPGYPWQRRRYWFEAASEPTDTWVCDETQALLDQHRLAGAPVFPAAAYLELIRGRSLGMVRELAIEVPLRLAPGERRRLRVRTDQGRATVESCAEGESHFVRHVSAQLADDTGAAPARCDVEAVRSRTVQTIEAEPFYQGMEGEGLAYGALYRRVLRVHLAEREALGELAMAEPHPGYEVHPGLLDACLQVFGAASLTLGRKGTYLPLAVANYRLHRSLPAGQTLYAHARVGAGDEITLEGDVVLNDASGDPLLSLHGVRFRRASAEALEHEGRQELCFGRVHFAPVDPGTDRSVRWELTSTMQTARSAALAAALADQPVAADAERGVLLLCEGGPDDLRHALETVQGLVRADAPVRLCLAATRGHGAAVLALGRTVELEHPELRCLRVSLAPEARASDIVQALAAADRERELLAGQGGVRAPRLTLGVPKQAEAPFAAPGDGVILVTGGLGALGLAVAEWLVLRGARDILLVTRSAPDAATDERLSTLRERASVRTVQLDVCDEKGLHAALGGAPLRGIVHAAGVLDDGVLREQTWERFLRVLAPKVRGAELLARLARAHRPAFVLFFSSTAALLGAAGQGAYASANAHLDALATALSAEGIAACSIQWGPWSGAGMAGRQSPAYLARLRSLGIAPLEREQTRRALDALAAAPEPVLSVVSVDRRQMRRALASGAAPALFDELAPAGAVQGGTSQLWSRLAGLSPGARQGELEALVHAQAARVLMLDAREPIDGDTPLGQLGMDSLMAIELRNGLGAALGKTFSATLLFDHPTLRALSSFLERQFASEAHAAAPEVRSAASDEAIAIIGMACRFPGGADTPERFWQLLASGVDAITDVPADRWDVDAFFDRDPDAPGKMYARHGGFVRDLDRFDAHFFGISPVEAKSLDPQQRLLLEVCWEALEHAGIVPAELAGSDTGVFVGIGASGYASEAMKTGDLSQIDAFAATGNTSSAAVGRLSYTLGLEGPNVSIDTACSSSLVSVHLASQSLRLGESRLAIAGGVNVLLSPEVSVMVAKARMLSPDGRCKAFDAAADGYVRSEGCGLVVMKRLRDALADGDRIWGVLRGSAVNQDGRSSGLTAPSGRAQEAVIRRALRSARLSGSDVSYVEAHGTGTALGDPIELSALCAALSPERDRPLLVGSVKTNIGHLEMAAGIAGLIKILLAFEHDALPASLHLRTPNPHVPWEQLNVEVLTAQRSWPRDARRVAGLSSFGFSGTNAHAILEAPPARPSRAARGGPALVLLSARTEGALRALARAYAERLREHPEWSVAELARATHTTRARLERRVAVVSRELSGVADALARFAAGDDGAVVHGRVLPPARRRVRKLESDTHEEAVWRRWGIAFADDGELAVTMRPAADELARLRQLATLVVRGVEPDWDAVDGEAGKRHLDLPTYPWQRQRFWLDAQPMPKRMAAHPLLRDGKARLSLAEVPMLADHRVHERVVVPAALLLDLVLARAQCDALEDISLHEALLVADDAVVNASLALTDGRFEVRSTEDDGSDATDPVHMSGRTADGLPAERVDIAALRARCAVAVPVASFYAALAGRGMVYGPTFQVLSALSVGNGEAFGELTPQGEHGFRVHPALLDGALQLLAAALASRGAEEVRLPVHIARLTVAAAREAPALAHASVRAGQGGDLEGHVRVLDARGEVLVALQGVQLRAVAPQLLEALDGVRVQRHAFELSFRPAPAAEARSLAGTRWGILLEDTGVGARLAARLKERGAEVVRAARPNELAAVACDGVICLSALAADSFGDQPERALEAACRPVLELVQAAPATSLLVLGTRGAQQARPADRLLSPFQAAVWGLGRSIAAERPELATLLVDADPAHPGATAEQILDAILSCGRESQIAYRDGERLVARLSRARVPREGAPRLRGDGCYLITGGLGALGLHAARELAANGAREIALLSRSEPSDDQRAQLAALEALGVRVHSLRADVADRAALEAALTALSLPLAGVIHTAGVLDDALLDQQTWESFRCVLGAKVLGALHLRAVTRRLSLDFTIHYSSTAGLLGAAGQANYAAANACLDALAALERGEGRRTLSVAFGAWSGGGMAARQAESSLAHGPFAALAPHEGRAALRLALGSPGRGPSTLAFTKLRAHRLSRALGARRPVWLDELVTSAEPAENRLGEELAALEPGARERRIGELLRTELRRALGLAADEPLPGDAELTSLGVDSLLAIQVPQLLGGLFGLGFGSTLLRDHPTLDALARHIAEALSPQAIAPSPPSVLVLKRAAQRAPLVCLGGAPGDALYLGALARHLPPEQPFYALEAPGLDGRGAPLDTIEAIASHHLSALDREGVRGPYLLAGHSFGGFVAFELARQVRARGDQVKLVALLDSVGVEWNDAQLPFDEGWVASELARVLFYTLGERHPGLAFAELEALPPFERVLRLVGSGSDSELTRPLARRLLAVMKANLEAMVRYRVSDYPGEIHLFRAREQLGGVLSGQFTYGAERDLGWHAASGAQVLVHDVPGNHFSMMGEPHVRSLAGALSRVLGLAREAAE